MAGERNPRQGQSHREVAVAKATSRCGEGGQKGANRTVMRKASSLVTGGQIGMLPKDAAPGDPRYAAAPLIGPLAENSPASECRITGVNTPGEAG